MPTTPGKKVVDTLWPAKIVFHTEWGKKTRVGLGASIDEITKAPELADLVREFLCDQETLRAPIRNEALCEKARTLLADLG